MRIAATVMACTVFGVAFVWFTHVATGTNWAISFVAVWVAGLWCADVAFRRPSTRIARMEQQDEPRRAA